MLVTLEGMIALVSPLHLENAPSPILLTLLGIGKEHKLLHAWNA